VSFLGISDQRFVAGSEEEDRRRTRDEYRRQHALDLAAKSGLPEIPHQDLEPRPFAILEDRASGVFFVPIRGVVDDPKRSGATAFYLDPSGQPVYLQRPASGPKSRAELEQHRAEREARRAQPRPKPTWTR
jgi:hypothetical protein